MRTIETVVYKLHELSQEAQENALELWNNEDVDIPWQEENLDSMKKGLEFYGFKLKDWSFDYYCATSGMFKIFSEHSYEQIEELSGARLYKYLLNNFSTYRSQYGDRKIEETLSGNCPFTGYCADESFLDPIRAFMALPTNITFMELMDQCIHEVAKMIEADYEYSQSMENFVETCEANGYEFTVDGVMI